MTVKLSAKPSDVLRFAPSEPLRATPTAREG